MSEHMSCTCAYRCETPIAAWGRTKKENYGCLFRPKKLQRLVQLAGNVHVLQLFLSGLSDQLLDFPLAGDEFGFSGMALPLIKLRQRLVCNSCLEALVLAACSRRKRCISRESSSIPKCLRTSTAAKINAGK